MMAQATFVSLGGGGGFVRADSCAHAARRSNKVGDVVGPPAHRVARMAELGWTRTELEGRNVVEMNERMDRRDVELKRVQGVRLVGALCR